MEKNPKEGLHNSKDLQRQRISMKSPVRILHLDSNPNFSDVIKTVLEADGINSTVKYVESRHDFLSELSNNRFDLIFAEFSLPTFDGPSALAITNKLYPHIPFIFFSESFDEGSMVDCMKNGARDFVTKRMLSRLALVVSRVMQEAEDRLERQRTQEALKASQEYAQSIINSSLDLIITVDLGRRIVEFNKSAEDAFGYRRDEVVGRAVDMLYAKPRQGLHIYKTTLLKGGCVEEVLNKRKNGEVFHSLLSASLIHNSLGELRGVMGVSRDITETKRAEEKLREQAALLDVAQDAIIIQDLKGTIGYWNKSAERLYGWLNQEVAAKKYNEIFREESSPQTEDCKKYCMEKGEWRGVLRQRTKDGNEIIVESRWTLVRDSDGSPKSIFLVNTDISERKKLEGHLLRTQRIESIGTLAGGISHDLNNVLTPILGGLQILKRKVTDVQQQRLIETLAASAKRGTDIVKQVLTFARGAEGEKIVLQPKHLIYELDKILRGTFPKSIQISRNILKDLWTIYGDATQIHQVLLNLCVNSRDAMPNGGTLTITAGNILIDENYARMNLEAKPGPYIVITVSDNGTGIPPGIIDKIFEPFFTTKDPGKGTGLGLATVMALVKGHSGFLNVYSEVGKGTTFKIYLPAAEAVGLNQNKEEKVEFVHGDGEMILVADDEDSILEISKETLETFGYRVLTATDGTEAVALLAQNRGVIDIVVTDMMMPFMDGPATIRALRKIDPYIRIIATSGLGVDGRAAEAHELGVQAFITKPYTAESLLKTLRKILHNDQEKPLESFVDDSEDEHAQKVSRDKRNLASNTIRRAR